MKASKELADDILNSLRTNPNHWEITGFDPSLTLTHDISGIRLSWMNTFPFYYVTMYIGISQPIEFNLWDRIKIHRQIAEIYLKSQEEKISIAHSKLESNRNSKQKEK